MVGLRPEKRDTDSTLSEGFALPTCKLTRVCRMPTWVGHGAKSITEVYTKLKENAAKRHELCEQVGIGFSLPKVGKVVKMKGAA